MGLFDFCLLQANEQMASLLRRITVILYTTWQLRFPVQIGLLNYVLKILGDK